MGWVVVEANRHSHFVVLTVLREQIRNAQFREQKLDDGVVRDDVGFVLREIPGAEVFRQWLDPLSPFRRELRAA